ncbi:elongator complex protein 3 [Candidatus Undinarchaeota archaeon]
MRELIEKLLKNPTASNLEKLRREYGKRGGTIPSNSSILANCTEEEKKKLKVLRTKPVRSLSGISVIAVMYPGYECPGKCIYCPTSEIAPKSYTGYEPAARRARSNNFNPYKQIQNRLDQLHGGGHPTDKCEMIIMGGTFPSETKEYQERFTKRCFDALNNKTSRTLKTAQKLNETSKNRCIGLTIETRPDFCSDEEIEIMLNLGSTRVELGVQSVYDDVLKKICRGHDVQETIDATERAKKAGMKVVYHIMPGLPGSDKGKDIRMFKKLFSNNDFKPDMMKLYPCLVIPGTKLHKMWKKGEYKPFSTEDAVEVITKATKYFPKYMRIMRMQRDIPINRIAAGSMKSNVTELVTQKLAEKGESCPCIRCREIGHKKVPGTEFELKRLDYKASKGKEIFLSYENKENDSIAAFLRLRHDENATIRELRVYGEHVPIGEKLISAKQHYGFGKKLLEEAERISDYEKLRILSGIGTKPYYRKFGYKDDGFYLSKEIGQ